MGMKATGVILLAAVVTAGPLADPVCAQTFPPFSAGSAEQARREVDGAIARPGYEQVFENISTTSTPAARHRQSGASCRFWQAKVFLGVLADHMFASRRVQPGEVVLCSTWIDLRGQDRLSFETRIVTAPLALDGKAYRGWDEEPDPPDRVTPAYLAWRSAYWAQTRQSSPIHEEPLSIRTADGRALPVHSVTVRTYGGHLSRHMAVMVAGWVVVQQLSAPARLDEAAARLALDQLQFTVGTIDRAHPQAEAQHRLTTEQVAADATGPTGTNDPLVREIYDTFVTACVQPIRSRKPFPDARRKQQWREVAAPPWLPGNRQAAERKAWLTSDRGGGIYVHYDAAMPGDCAVSVRESVSAPGLVGLRYRLTRAPGSHFAQGAYPRVADGIVSLALNGRAWEGEGSLIARTGESEARAGIFLGVRRHRRR